MKETVCSNDCFIRALEGGSVAVSKSPHSRLSPEGRPTPFDGRLLRLKGSWLCSSFQNLKASSAAWYRASMCA